MPSSHDGPRSSRFTPLPFNGNLPLPDLAKARISEEMVNVLEYAPSGSCTAWGIPFEIGEVVAIARQRDPTEEK